MKQDEDKYDVKRSIDSVDPFVRRPNRVRAPYQRVTAEDDCRTLAGRLQDAEIRNVFLAGEVDRMDAVVRRQRKLVRQQRKVAGWCFFIAGCLFAALVAQVIR